MKRPALRAIALLAAVLLFAAGCGSDDESESSDSGGDQAGSSSVVSDSSSSSSSDADSHTSRGAFTSANCLQAYQDFAQLAGAGPLTGQGGSMDEVADAFRSYADAAPDELEDAFNTLADGYASIGQAMSDAGIDLSDPSSITADKAQEFARISEALNDSGLEEAGDKISQWFENECGVSG